MKKLVYGVGVNDADHAVNVNGKHIKAYATWKGMLERGYSDKYKAKNPTYNDVTVCDEWLSFSNFERWFNDHYIEGYHLDKDILFPSNKVYSPDTCVFVPGWLNKFVTDCGASRGEYPVGVHYNKQCKKFRAMIRMNGKQKHLGRFDTPEAAHLAWLHDKRDQIHNRKPELDNIDHRLYQALLNRYPLPSASNDCFYDLMEAA